MHHIHRNGFYGIFSITLHTRRPCFVHTAYTIIHTIIGNSRRPYPSAHSNALKFYRKTRHGWQICELLLIIVLFSRDVFSICSRAVHQYRHTKVHRAVFNGIVGLKYNFDDDIDMTGYNSNKPMFDACLSLRQFLLRHVKVYRPPMGKHTRTQDYKCICMRDKRDRG